MNRREELAFAAQQLSAHNILIVFSRQRGNTDNPHAELRDAFRRSPVLPGPGSPVGAGARPQQAPRRHDIRPLHARTRQPATFSARTSSSFLSFGSLAPAPGIRPGARRNPLATASSIGIPKGKALWLSEATPPPLHSTPLPYSAPPHKKTAGSPPPCVVCHCSGTVAPRSVARCYGTRPGSAAG